jgi:single-strand DNA-binding protein
VQNINSVVITGNLTRDPELRHTGSGTAVCELRVAVNGRRKNGEEWVDKPNYFNVTVFGGRGAAAEKHLFKGNPVAVEGRLDWSEWDAKDGSGKRQGVKIVAENVQFLGSKPTDEEAGATDSQGEDRQPAAVGAESGDEDIPF